MCTSCVSYGGCREPPEEGLMCEMLWSDPQYEPGRTPNKRGVGIAFGELGAEGPGKGAEGPTHCAGSAGLGFAYF